MQNQFSETVWLISLLVILTTLVFAGSASAFFEDLGIIGSIHDIDDAFELSGYDVDPAIIDSSDLIASDVQGIEKSAKRSGDTVTLHIYKFWDGTEKVAVIYNPNGGTGLINVVPLDINSNYTITDQGYTRNDYSFTGWNTKADGSGDSYSNGQMITMLKSLVLYAQWAPTISPTYTLTYDANGGDSNSIPAPQSRNGPGDLTISLVEPIRSDYDFLGWSENSGDVTAQYQPDDSIYMDSDKTLYAVWEEEQFFTITYYPNEGDGDIKVYYVKSGDDYTVTDQGYTRQYYVFSLWDTMPNGYGFNYDNGYIIRNVNSDIVLYAQWERPL